MSGGTGVTRNCRCRRSSSFWAPGITGSLLVGPGHCYSSYQKGMVGEPAARSAADRLDGARTGLPAPEESRSYSVLHSTHLMPHRGNRAANGARAAVYLGRDVTWLRGQPSDTTHPNLYATSAVLFTTKLAGCRTAISANTKLVQLTIP